MIYSKLLSSLLICSYLSFHGYDFQYKKTIKEDLYCGVYRSEGYTLKIFKDSNSGSMFYCHFIYPIHNGVGSFYANCKIVNNEILIYNPIILRKLKKISISTKKFLLKKNDNRIKIKVKTRLLPYNLLINGKMIKVEKARYSFLTSKDTVNAEFFFEEGFSEPLKLLVNHGYRISSEYDYSFSPIEKWIPPQSKITRGYFQNDSIVFPCTDKDLVLKKVLSEY